MNSFSQLRISKINGAKNASRIFSEFSKGNNHDVFRPELDSVIERISKYAPKLSSKEFSAFIESRLREVSLKLTSPASFFKVTISLPDKVDSLSNRESDSSYFIHATEWLEENLGSDGILRSFLISESGKPRLVFIMFSVDRKGKSISSSWTSGKKKMLALQSSFVDKFGV